MKKIISLFMAVVLCVSLFGTVTVVNAQENKTFDDIIDYWAQSTIEYMASHGIMNGVSDTEFAPARAITRAEFLALVLRVMGESEVPYDNAYADVTDGKWYANAIQAGKNLGLIDEAMTPDGNFKPDTEITREEMTSLIIRAYEIKKGTPSTADISVFEDSAEISEWATEYVKSAYSLELIMGTTKTTLSPKKTASRAEAATMARRLLKATTEAKKSIKVLALGNSFSLDSMQYLYGMLNANGYDDIVLGILYIGGCSLEKHDTYIKEKAPKYKYYKNTDGKWVITNEQTVDFVLNDEEWEIFSLQQSSGESGLADTYEPYITEIIKYVKENGLGEDVEFAWNLTWAYQGDSTHKTFEPNYNSDQMYMYNQILNATKVNVDTHEEFKYIFPVGTTVQNARTSFIGDTFTRDGYHMNYYIGRYMAALTWFTTLTDIPAEDVNYNPNKNRITDAEVEAAIEAVTNAIANPREVTPSKLIEVPAA